MVNRSKKRGSSLLITVGMFAVLSILIMSVLAMTTSGYSLRIKNNKRIENFYGADSGLEISQKVIHDCLSEAVEKAKEKVETSGLTEMKDKEELFKEIFIREIREGTSSIPKIEAKVNDPSKYSAYADTRGTGTKMEIKSKLNYKLKGIKEKVTNDDSKNINSSTVTDEVFKYDNKEIENFILDVKSNFTDRNGVDREVQVEFELLIPEYGEVLIQTKTSGAPDVLDYIVGVDGDFNFNIEDTVYALGDLWVKGNKPSIVDKNNKYKGGVTLQGNNVNNAILTWLGSIATPATLNVNALQLKMNDTSQNRPKELKENIYAGNFIYGYNGPIKGAELIGKYTDVYVHNDFILGDYNSSTNKIGENKNSEFSFDNLYALNDIDIANSNNFNNAEKSSSMLIKTDKKDPLKLHINNSAFILGTSYMDLGDLDYQTGHSSVINNISKPYTSRENGNSEKYIYDYKGNMHIVDSIKNEKAELNKVEVAENYKMTTEEKSLASKIEIGTIYSPGVVLANGDQQKHNIPLTIGEKSFPKYVEGKQEEYVKEALNMGADGEYFQRDFWANNSKVSVNNSFKWDEIKKLSQTLVSNSNLDVEYTNNEDLIHIKSKETASNILIKAHDEAKKATDDKQKHPLATYGSASGISGLISNKKLNIILNASGKTMNIVHSASTNGISKDNVDGSLDYNIAASENEAATLIISNGIVNHKDFYGYKNYMIISSKTVNLTVPNGSPETTHFGNYENPSMDTGYGVKYEKSQFKLINELFKYSLLKADILGAIGGSIFEGSEQKVATNAIEVSNLINKKNWKLNK